MKSSRVSSFQLPIILTKLDLREVAYSHLHKELVSISTLLSLTYSRPPCQRGLSTFSDPSVDVDPPARLCGRRRVHIDRRVAAAGGVVVAQWRQAQESWRVGGLPEPAHRSATVTLLEQKT